MGLNLGSIGKKIEDILGAGVGAVGHEIGQLPNQILHLGAPAPTPAPPVAAPQPMQIPRTLGPQALGLSPTLYNPNNMPQSLVLPPPAPTKSKVRQGILGAVSPIVAGEATLAKKALTTPISGKVLQPLTGSNTPVSAAEVIKQIPASVGSQVGGITGASEYYKHVQNIQALNNQLSQTDNPDDQNAIKAQIHKEVAGAATSVPRALSKLVTFPITAAENLGGATYAQATGKPSVKLPFVGEVPSFSQQAKKEGAGVTAANALVNLGAVAGGLKAAHGVVEGALPGATEAYHANPTLSSEAGGGQIDPFARPEDPLAGFKQEALKYKSADEFIPGKPMYRGASKAEWDAVQKTGKFGKQEAQIGNPQGVFNDDVHTVSNKQYAYNYAHTGTDNGVLIEYKPSANAKMRNTAVTDTTDMGKVQEARGKGLTLGDVQRVTDKGGNVIYEAPSGGELSVKNTPDVTEAYHANPTLSSEAGHVGLPGSGKFSDLPTVKLKTSGETVYRAGSELDPGKVTSEGISVTPNKDIAQKKFSNFWGKGQVQEHTISPGAKIMPFSEIPSELTTKLKTGEMIPAGADNGNYEKIIALAKQNGYDGVDLRRFGEGEIRILNPDVLVSSKSKLSVENILKGQSAIPSTPDELAMGKSLGMTPEQVAEAKATMDNPKLEGSSTEPVPAANEKALETATEQADAYNARLATAKNNPLYGQVGVPTVAEGDTARALQNPSTAQRMVVDPANEVLRQGSKLSEPDKQLLDLVKTTPRETILSRAKNPIRVGKTLDALKHYNDTTHALGTSLDQKLGYKENYGARQFFDISKEDIAKESTHSGSSAPYGLERKYVDYAQGGEKGLTRLHSNILQDVAHDAAIRARTLSERALQQGLEQAHPGEVVDVTQTSIPRGWKQLRIPSGENLAMPQELADQINKRAIPDKAGLIGQAYDSATKADKTLAVGGNPFHGITEAFRFIGQQLLSPDALSHPIETLKAHARVFAGTFSKAAAEEASAGYEADGTRQWSRIGGQTLDKRAIAGDASMKWYDTANKANPIRAIHEAVFGREIPLQKQEIMRQAMQGSTDYTNPEMIAKARQVALATNHMFGGLDHSTDGFSPTMAKRLSRISFSGDYTEAKGRLLQDALTRADKQGNIARQAVIGKALVAATPGVIALSVAGKINWNDPKDVAKKIAGQIIDPSLPTSFKTASGIAKVALTPNSDVSELARVIEPFFNGDPNKLSGIEHWAVSRVNPVISPVVKLVTNQDYKGDPIWKHRVDAQGNDLGVDYLGTAKNLATGSLTSIGTNLAKVAEGKQSLAEAGVNMAGFRTAADQNDPRMKAMNFQSNLIKSQPKQLQIDYGATHPQRTDANGVVVQDRSFLDSASKAAAFLDNPKLLALDQQIADKNKALGLPTDPFYSLKPDQQKVVLNLTNDRGFNAGDPVIKRQTDDNPWLAKFYADRSAYYDSQNIKPDTVNPTDIPAPIADKPTQALLTQMDSLDGAGRAKLIQDNPMLSDFLAKNEQYTRDKRAALGKPQYDQYPVASPGVQKTLDAYNLLPKNTGERSAWIRSHPQEYVAMSAYLSKASLYNLEQSAGQAAFEGQSLDQKGLKAVSSLGQYDIVKNPDGTLALKYGDIGGGALPQPGAVSAVTSGGSGGKSSAQAAFERRELRNAGKSIRRRAPRVKVRSHSQSLLVNRAKPKKAFVAFYPTAGKRTFKHTTPKVSLKPSR